MTAEARARGEAGASGAPLRERRDDGRLGARDHEVRAREGDRRRAAAVAGRIGMAIREEVVVARGRGLLRRSPFDESRREARRVESPFEQHEAPAVAPARALRRAGRDDEIHVLLRVEARLVEEVLGVAADADVVGVREEARGERARPEVRDVDDAHGGRVGRDERERVVAAPGGGREREDGGEREGGRKNGESLHGQKSFLRNLRHARARQTAPKRPVVTKGWSVRASRMRRGPSSPMTRATTAAPSCAVFGKTQ